MKTLLPRNVMLKDPLLLASGCCGYGEEYSELFDPASIGGVITKAVSLEPRAGNDVPRLRETPAGLLNCIGLQNPGVEMYCLDTLPRICNSGACFLINVVGNTAEEFAQVIKRIEEELGKLAMHASENSGFCGYELDLSCPNVESGTMFATDPELLSQTVGLSRKNTEAFIVAKLSPNVTDIVPYATTAGEAGSDAVTIANTWNGVSINIETRRSNLARPSAGLSGPAIMPATLYHVWRCHQALPELPILASGGITDTDSAVQYLLAGAVVLQIGTGLFLDPTCPLKIKQGLLDYLDKQGSEKLADIIGTYSS